MGREHSILHYAIAGLELARSRGAGSVPLPGRVVGLVGFAAANGLLFWARWVNPFYSPDVRIQEDRGHRLVTGGPYRYVRHPGYLASILRLASSALSLGSWWSLVPAAISVALTIHWIPLEDDTLKAGLEGYAEYAKEVPYRLVPGIW